MIYFKTYKVTYVNGAGGINQVLYGSASRKIALYAYMLKSPMVLLVERYSSDAFDRKHRVPNSPRRKPEDVEQSLAKKLEQREYYIQQWQQVQGMEA